MHPLIADCVVRVGKALALLAMVVLGLRWLLLPDAEGL